MSKAIDITPDVSLLKKSGEVNYKIPQALAELVDNAIDALVRRQKLSVELTLGQKSGEKRIVIHDDAEGMSSEDAAKAMVMAYSGKGAGLIGEFGLGMKTACSFLGSKFEIVTATKGAKKAFRLIYDEEEFIKRGDWTIEMDEVKKPFSHGTRIEIDELKVNLYAGVKDAVLQNFSKTFKHFVASGSVEILINGDPVVPHVADTMRNYDTELRFDVGGKEVRGWVSLATRGSGKGRYGFDLVRHSRVLAEHQKIGFSAAPGTTRVVGELHLDDFPVVNNKTDFRRDTEEWHALIRELQKRLVDIARESRRLANPGAAKLEPKDAAELQEHVEKVQEALKSDDLQGDLDRRALDSELDDEFADGPLPFKLPDADAEMLDSGGGGRDGMRELDTVKQHRLNRVKTQLRNLTISHTVARLGKGSLYKIWEVQGVGVRKQLAVTTNSDHPMYMAMQDSFMLWIKHNIIEAVAEFFTDEAGQTDAMLLVKSDILKHISKMEIEEDEDEAGLAPTEAVV